MTCVVARKRPSDNRERRNATTSPQVHDTSARWSDRHHAATDPAAETGREPCQEKGPEKEGGRFS